MKKILLILMLFPALLCAQSEKYMAGAVPEMDGKVVFTRQLNVQDFSRKQIYKALLNWSNNSFTGKSGRVLFADEDKGMIAVQGEDEMLIKIGLFPGKVKASYLLTINSSDGNCTLTTSRIRYSNNPSSKESSDIIAAEDYITDKYALNKAKTKLFKGTGDYRSNTIDIVDKLALEAQNAIYAFYTPSAPQIAQQPAPRVAQPAPQKEAHKQPAPQKRETKAVKEKNVQTTAKEISPSAIPEKLMKAAAEKEMYITAVNGRKLNNAVAGKCVLNISPDKASAMFTLAADTDNILFLMEMAENYTLVLPGTGNQPELVLECRKGQQFDKTFIGEITDVKIK